MQFPPLPDWFWYPITFLYGAIVGSFLNVVIYRLPLGLNIWRENSHCPNCNHWLRAWDNIPILGFLLAGGRCRYCGVPISWRYISVELLTACLWVALFDRVSDTASISWVNYVFQALFASVLVALIFIDLDHFFAPDELNVVGFVLALGRDVTCLVMAYLAGGYVWQEWDPRFAYFKYLPRAIPGALVYGGLLFVVSVGSFLYYNYQPGDGLLTGLRRYRAYYNDEPTDVGDSQATVANASEVADLARSSIPTEVGATLQTGETFSPPTLIGLLPPELPAPEAVQSGFDPEQNAAEEHTEPPRMRFSPGILAIVSAILLATVVHAWGLLALAVPASAFLLLGRRSGEAPLTALRRFFQPDEDDDYARDDPALRQAAEDADQFAQEAETGAHGGMGLGDAKLALAIGALLGPMLALVSLFVATLVGAAVGIGLKVKHRRGDLKFGIPFVPFMVIGAIVTMLYGQEFVEWYAGLISPEAHLQQRAPAYPAFRVKPGSRRTLQPAATPHLPATP